MDKFLKHEGGMEAELVETLDRIAATERCEGVVAAQANGTCLGARTGLGAESAGFVRAMAAAAAALDPSEPVSCVVIERDATDITITTAGAVTTGILMRTA
eukprot:c7396_g1_i2.p3 GENE.c7396_g1_i2~~c7396_g1_i2.p3  ORF type:complete len:101 (+),score=23.54 c7396_g1_i2:84-386(+)